MSRGTQDAASPISIFRLQAYHPLRNAFPCVFDYIETVLLTRSYNPGKDGCPHFPVWANPRSLATTRGISLDFFSSGY